MDLYLINLKKNFNEKTKMNSISQIFAIGDIHGCNSLLKKIQICWQEYEEADYIYEVDPKYNKKYKLPNNFIFFN